MPSRSYSSIQGVAARFTRLDVCGVPQTGLTASAVSDGFIRVAATHNYDEGQTTEQRNAAGRRCIYERDEPKLSDIDLAVDFCSVDPEMWELASGQQIVLDADGNAVGFRLSEDAPRAAFGLEVWSRIPGELCAGGTEQWLYWLWPFASRFQLGGLTVENGAATFSFTASTKGGAGWGVGPHDVVADALDAAVPLLTPLTAGDHFHNQITTIAPPVPVDGYVAVAA